MSVLSAKVNFAHSLARMGFRAQRVVNKINPATAEIELDLNELWQLTGDNRWRAIVCLQGEIWVTQPHDLNDYLLTEGEMLLITQPGTVVIQAREPSRFQITPSLAISACVADFARAIFS